jgi:DNA topoisomerase-1
MSDKYPIVRKKKYYWKNGKEVKDQKTLERIKKLRIPPAYKNVKIYSRNSDIQYTGVDDKGRTQTGYHERRIRERNRKKFNGLIAFVEAYPKIMKKVNKLIVNPKTKEQYVALAIALMDACRIRPGSEKHLRDTGSYGTTTLLKKHIKKGKNISLVFNGKSGVLNVCTLKKNTNIAKSIYTLKKTSENFIFETKDFKVTGKDINTFLKQFGDISAKSFRTYHANILFIKKLLSFTDFSKKNVIQAIKESSEELHHTPATFKNSYLFTPIKDLYLENPTKFKKTFKNVESGLVKFVKKMII